MRWGGLNGAAAASAASQAGIFAVSAYGAWKVGLSNFTIDALLMLTFPVFVGAFYLIHRVTEQIWDSRIVSITVIVAILSCVVAIAFLAIRKSHQAMKI